VDNAFGGSGNDALIGDAVNNSGGVTAVFGSPDQMKVYSKYVASILEWTQNKSGLVALIAAPEALLPILFIW
jgi:hypothetical protein